MELAKRFTFGSRRSVRRGHSKASRRRRGDLVNPTTPEFRTSPRGNIFPRATINPINPLLVLLGDYSNGLLRSDPQLVSKNEVREPENPQGRKALTA